MGLLDLFRHNKIKEPIFYNEHDDERLKSLEELLDKVGDDQKQLILDEMNLIQIGLSGEKNVIFELMHSTNPIVFLHDVTLPNVMTDSQIDFIVITRKGLIVLETKKLIGDVTIDSEGNFTRYFKNSKGEVYKKEGIYSPITQNRYHVDALRKLLNDNKYSKNIPILSVVVIANPKSIVNKKYAQSDVKKQVVKYDQLNNLINDVINFYQDVDISDNVMLEIAELIKTNDTCKSYNYIEKLKLNIIEEVEEEIEELKEDTTEINENDSPEENKSNDELYEKLRSYRYQKSVEQKVKPYYIFTNEVLEQLILVKPKNKEEFISINGLGEAKYNSYGEDIIRIIYPNELSKTLEDNNDNDALIKELKKFRYQKAEEENIPVYYIFNNQQMDSLIQAKPKTKEDLLKINGFGPVKVEKYGEEILNILNNH